ncbi:heavy metal-associated isoprenylated plant protein 41-like [Primulina huaijiensis]|uniref:heavy metal-associated isoprenylated plant protein 41-like n=1 Tax=Primulina huaijiensis TaxID=1492673 RepID=UPI003CC71298
MEHTVVQSGDKGEDEKWIKHYSNRHEILLVGEGDFSFSASLARAFGHASNIVATSLDTKEELAVKHPTAAQNLATLENMGCTVIHGVDASTMCEHPRLKNRLFDRIVFNFPHAGFDYREHHIIQTQLHQDVVRGFLRNAAMMLKIRENGEVHVM